MTTRRETPRVIAVTRVQQGKEDEVETFLRDTVAPARASIIRSGRVAGPLQRYGVPRRRACLRSAARSRRGTSVPPCGIA